MAHLLIKINGEMRLILSFAMMMEKNFLGVEIIYPIIIVIAFRWLLRLTAL